MCCFTQNILTLRLSVGGRTDARTHARTENIYSIFRDKLLLLGEHGYDNWNLISHDHNMVFSYGCGQQRNHDIQKKGISWPFR